MRALHKAWQNQRPGWTHRVRWYEGPGKHGGRDIRLNFVMPEGEVNLTYTNKEAAQRDYDAFAEGTLGYWQLLELKG